MIVYHGSDHIIEKPVLGQNRGNRGTVLSVLAKQGDGPFGSVPLFPCSPARSAISFSKYCFSSVSVIPHNPAYCFEREMSVNWFRSLKILTLWNFETPVIKINCIYSS